jgi:hypothetical protein
MIFFLNFAVSELFSLERVQKMLQNEPLDVKTFDDTAENEAFQIPKIVNPGLDFVEAWRKSWVRTW